MIKTIRNIRRYTSTLVSVENTSKSQLEAQRHEKETRLSIKIPFTNFKPRYMPSKTEPILSQKVYSSIQKILDPLTKDSNSTKYIFDTGATLDAFEPNINDVFRLLYADFEQKYRLLNKEPYQLITGINLIDKSIKELNYEVTIEKIMSYINSLVRWGVYLNPKFVFTSLSHSYLDCVYDVFKTLKDNNLIYERLDMRYWSTKLESEVFNKDIKRIDEKFQFHFVTLKITDYGDNEIVRKQFGDVDLNMIITMKELKEIVLADGIIINPNKNYVFFKIEGRYYLCADDLINKDSYFKENKKLFIDKRAGSELLGWKVYNPINDEELETYSLTELTDIKDIQLFNSSSGIMFLCPHLNKQDFEIVRNFDLNFNVRLEHNGNILYGKYKDNNIKFIEDKLKVEIKPLLNNQLFIVGTTTKLVHVSNEEQIFLFPVKSIFARIPQEVKQKMLDQISEIKTIGPEKAYGKFNLDKYIEKLEEIKIAEEAEFGIPVPLLHYKGSRKRYVNSPDIIENYREIIKRKEITEWNNIEMDDVLSYNLKAQKNLIFKDKRVFSGDFLKILNFYYTTRYFDVDSSNLLLEDYQNKKTNDSIPKSSKKTNPTLCETYMASVIDNENLLPQSLMLQLMLEGSITISTIRYVCNLVNEKLEKVEQKSSTIINGIIKKDQTNPYGYGSESFRLYTSAVDLKNVTYTDLVLQTQLMNIKMSEINIIRKFYWDLLKYIGSDLVNESQINFNDLPAFEKLIMNELDLFIRIITNAYEECDYNKVYTTYMDFLKTYVIDFYLEGRRRNLILNENEQLIKNVKFVLSEIVLNTLVIMSPILPLNTEQIYESLSCIKDKQSSIFEESWPSPIKILNKDAVENHNDLMNLLNLKEKLNLINKNNKTPFDILSYDIDLVLDKFPEEDNYDTYKSEMQIFLEKYEDSLNDIIGCGSIKIIYEKLTKIPEHNFITTFKLKTDKAFVPIVIYGVRRFDYSKCERCELYKCEDNDTICRECAPKVSYI